MENSGNLRRNLEDIARIAGRILPLVEHIPDSLGKWVPPIKAAVKANEKMVASISLAGAASKALKGRLSITDAVMVGFSASTLGASKKMSVLAGVGALAGSKIVRGFKDAGREASLLKSKTSALAKSPAFSAAPTPRPSPGGKSRGGGGGSFLGINPGLLAAGGLVAGAVRAMGMFRRTLDLGSELQDMSDKTGVAVDQLLVLREAARDAGIEDILGPVAKMQKGLIAAVQDGVSPAAAALDRLGLSATALVQASPVDAIEQIGERISAIENPTLKAATAMEIFGKSGAQMLPLFADRGALGTAARAIGGQARILRENAAAFDQVSDRLRRSGLKLQGFNVGVVKALLPALDAFTAKFDKLDLAAQGEKFGAALARAGEDFAKAFKGADVEGALKLMGAAGGALGTGIGKVGKFLSDVNKGMDTIAGSIAGGTLIKDLTANSGAIVRDDSGLNAILQKRIAAAMQKAKANNPVNPMLGWKAAHTWDMQTSASSLGGGKLRAGSSAIGDEAFSRIFRSNNDGKALTDALKGGATRSTALLPRAERRAFEDAMFAETGKRPESGGAYNVIRRGDAAAKKEMARASERKKNEDKLGVTRSNALLEDIGATLKEGLL